VRCPLQGALQPNAILFKQKKVESPTATEGGFVVSAIETTLQRSKGKVFGRKRKGKGKPTTTTISEDIVSFSLMFLGDARHVGDVVFVCSPVQHASLHNPPTMCIKSPIEILTSLL